MVKVIKLIVKSEDELENSCSFCTRGEEDGLTSLIGSKHQPGVFICQTCAEQTAMLMKITEETMMEIHLEYEANGYPEPTGGPDCPCPSCELNRRVEVKKEQLVKEWNERHDREHAVRH